MLNGLFTTISGFAGLPHFAPISMAPWMRESGVGTMTAILDDMRRLDAAHARGDLSAVDLVAAKAKLLDSVPDASEPARSRPAAPRPRRASVWPVLLLCVMVVTVCAGAALLLTGDVMLSATLGITVLAAITIMLFRQLDG